MHSGDSIEKNMYGVLIALIPAFLVAVYVFRLDALIITALSVLFCVGFEYLIARYIMKKEPSVFDGSAIITGVLLAFNVPSNLPIWILALGALFSIGVVKMSFGGLGNNIFNPAIAGRIFLLISFPAQMTTWPAPVIDATTSATVLSNLRFDPGSLPAIKDMFFGFEGGSIGEMSALALLLGLVYMLWKKIITWHIPVSIIVSVGLFTGILYIFNPVPMFNPLIHLFSGGLMLGAIFMATDYVTSPMTKSGMLIYGVSIGFITVCIRLWGAYPEGVSFAILLMNAFTPLINNYTTPKRYGEVVKNG
ncbi:Electron transport complex subunit RsxD [bioreactor metagenome]|uniref:Electron transport complex subunit RsxD n=1 Tax=bioreactor metagenome TaxID=1076179 RepID=A0A645C8Z0_9ZZZZ